MPKTLTFEVVITDEKKFTKAFDPEDLGLSITQIRDLYLASDLARNLGRVGKASARTDNKVSVVDVPDEMVQKVRSRVIGNVPEIGVEVREIIPQ